MNLWTILTTALQNTFDIMGHCVVKVNFSTYSGAIVNGLDKIVLSFNTCRFA